MDQHTQQKQTLISDVQQFIHRYVDLSPTFEKIATYYVLLSWLYDVFNDLPYLRLRGDFGTGKTRALLVLGSICYKAFFASGASTVSYPASVCRWIVTLPSPISTCLANVNDGQPSSSAICPGMVPV